MFGFFATVSFIISGFLFISVCWTKIYQHFKFVSDSIKGVDAAKRKRQLAEGEHKVFIKAVSLSASYGICWAGMVIAVIIQQSSGTPISVAADIYCMYMVLFYALVCPLVLILTDNRVGSAVIPFLYKNVVEQVPESIAAVVRGRSSQINSSNNMQHPGKRTSMLGNSPSDVVFE